MTQEEVIKLNLTTANYYDDNEYHIYTVNKGFNSEPPNTPYVPPFKFFLTSVGHGTGTSRIATRTLSINTNVIHGKPFT